MRFFRDVANVTMDINGVETVHFNALGGADNITVGDLSGTDVTQVQIDLAGTPGGTTGDNANDTVTVNGTNAKDVVEVLGSGGSVAVVGLCIGVRFPPTERAAAGVSMPEMFRELLNPLFIVLFGAMFLTAASEVL